MTDTPHAIRLLLADVDGTILTPDHALTPQTVAAVQRLRDADIAVTLTTGRPPQGLTSLISALDLTDPLAALSGGVIVRPDLDVIIEHRMEFSAAETAVAVLTGGAFDIWVYTADQWLVRGTPGPRVDREAAIVGFHPTVVENFDAVLSRVVKIVGVSDDPLAVVRMTAEARRRCGRRVLVMSEPPYTAVEITDPLANTGEVLMALADAFDVPVEQVATIGASAVDVPMFEASGVSVAMGQASAEVQGAASFVAPSNADNGFAVAVERFVPGTGPA